MHKVITVKKGKIHELRWDEYQRQIYVAPVKKRFVTGAAITNKIVNRKILKDIGWSAA